MMTPTPFRARTAGLLAATLLLPLTSCSTETLVGPLPTAHIKRYAKTAGRHVVTFQFENRGSTPLAKPDIKTSCGCHEVAFSVDPIPPGGTAVLTIAQESGVFPVRGNAHLVWADGRADAVDWVILADTDESLMVSPMRISADTIAREGGVTLAFVADYLDDKPEDHQPRLLAQLAGAELNAEIQHVEPDGDGRFRGYLRVDVSELAALDGTAPLEITHDILGTVPVTIY